MSLKKRKCDFVPSNTPCSDEEEESAAAKSKAPPKPSTAIPAPPKIEEKKTAAIPNPPKIEETKKAELKPATTPMAKPLTTATAGKSPDTAVKSASGAPTEDDLNHLWQRVRDLLSSKDKDSFVKDCEMENMRTIGRIPKEAVNLKSLVKVLTKQKSFSPKATEAELKALCKALEIVVDEKKELISFVQLCDAV